EGADGAGAGGHCGGAGIARRLFCSCRCAAEGAWAGLADGGGNAQPPGGGGRERAGANGGGWVCEAARAGARGAWEEWRGAWAGGGEGGRGCIGGGGGSHCDGGDELPRAGRLSEPRELLVAAGERRRRCWPAAAPLEPRAVAAIGGRDGKHGAGRRLCRRGRG